jgi:hypothetical protein
MVVMIMEAAVWMGIELLGLQECGRCNASAGSTTGFKVLLVPVECPLCKGGSLLLQQMEHLCR